MTIPMKDQKAHKIAEHLVKKVYTKFGPPARVLTDKGTNFFKNSFQRLAFFLKSSKLKLRAITRRQTDQ